MRRSFESCMKLFLSGLLAIVFASLAPTSTRADFIVAAGWDLYTTAAAVNVAGNPFIGLPLGTFSFDLTHQNVNTGTTDTIIRRLAPAIVVGAGGTATVGYQIQALQLQSVGAIDLGGGSGIHFLTLSGGLQTIGSNAITFTNSTGGTFTASIPVDFVIRKDDINTGPVVFASSTTINQTNESWGEVAPLGALTIDDINFMLDPIDNDTSQDFWAGSAPSIESVPEPTLALSTCLSLAGIALVSVKRRFRKKKSDLNSRA